MLLCALFVAGCLWARFTPANEGGGALEVLFFFSFFDGAMCLAYLGHYLWARHKKATRGVGIFHFLLAGPMLLVNLWLYLTLF